MGVEPVPDHQQRRADLAAEIPQGQDHGAARDTGAEMTSIKPPIRRDRHHARDLAPLADPPEHRGQAAPRPGRARPSPETVAGLVPEEKRPVLPPRLFSKPPTRASARPQSQAHHALWPAWPGAAR